MITDFNKIRVQIVSLLQFYNRSARTIQDYLEQLKKLERAHHSNNFSEIDINFVDIYEAYVRNHLEISGASKSTIRRHKRFMLLLREIIFSPCCNSLDEMKKIAESTNLWFLNALSYPDNEFSNALAEFKNKLGVELKKDTIEKYFYSTKKFLLILSSSGINSLNQITPTAIYQGLSKVAASNEISMRTFVDGPKKFFRWLYECKKLSQDFSLCLRVKISKRTPLLRFFTQEHIEKILNSIDLSDKKNFILHAFITLLADTGLRFSDAINLKVSDLDWKNKRLSLTQSKTGKKLEIPISEKLAESLSRYMLEARDASAKTFVFSSIKTPSSRISKNFISELFRKLRSEALGDDFKLYGFHSFRRGLGTRLFQSETPIYLISQILGHQNVDSSKPYLKLDATHLKTCGLPFPGEILRGDLRHD